MYELMELTFHLSCLIYGEADFLLRKWKRFKIKVEKHYFSSTLFWETLKN